ncbi:MAG TPA: hypothetical protein P5069_01630 [Candidatus Hydrogenedentes bacterium]|nr:hypothetical protein [Candidatus Hydrogenedentota bacterium]HRZ81124.1 hypothetical protein [Candidatus Hydrogenedentota bacterium]
MSGTVVVAPLLMPEVLSLLFGTNAAISAAAGMGIGAGAILKECVKAAEARREREKARLSEWLAFRERQMASMEMARSLEGDVEASERRLEQMVLAGPSTAHGVGDGDGPSQLAAAHRALGAERVTAAEVRASLADMTEALDAFPEPYRHAAGNPWERLSGRIAAVLAQLDRGETLAREELETLRETVRLSLSDFLEGMRRRRERTAELHARMEKALDAVLFYQGAVEALEGEDFSRYAGELATMERQILSLCAADTVPEGALDPVERRLDTLRGEIDKAAVRNAQRRGLSESITRNLEEMGYRAAQAFEPDQNGLMHRALFRIPGGEVVQVGLHQNFQLAFEVLHERPAGADPNAPFTLDELAKLSRQEGLWCDDMRKLIRRLVAEGYQYAVSYEQPLKEASIRVSVVESAEDVLDHADSAPESRRMEL